MFSLDINPYEVLGISPDADVMEVRRARRELVLKYPNELFPERAQEINKAFQLLTSRDKRRMVDAFLRSKAGCALRVQKAFLSDEVYGDLFDYPDRAEVFELFKLEGLVQVDRNALIESLLSVLE